MKMLGNLLKEINPLQKRRLYKCCTLPIALYGFLLWYYNKTSMNYHLSVLRKVQWRAALWILGTFHTSPTSGIKAISGLISIHFHLKKLYRRFLLRGSSLPSNHIISSIISFDGLHNYNFHSISIDHLTPKQRLCLKSTLIDMNNRYNEVFHLFHSSMMNLN